MKYQRRAILWGTTKLENSVFLLLVKNLGFAHPILQNCSTPEYQLFMIVCCSLGTIPNISSRVPNPNFGDFWGSPPPQKKTPKFIVPPSPKCPQTF